MLCGHIRRIKLTGEMTLAHRPGTINSCLFVPTLSSLNGLCALWCVSGGYGRNRDIAVLPDGESEEAVMEWFAGEVANLEGNNTARKGTSEEQV